MPVEIFNISLESNPQILFAVNVFNSCWFKSKQISKWLECLNKKEVVVRKHIYQLLQFFLFGGWVYAKRYLFFVKLNYALLIFRLHLSSLCCYRWLCVCIGNSFFEISKLIFFLIVLSYFYTLSSYDRVHDVIFLFINTQC